MTVAEVTDHPVRVIAVLSGFLAMRPSTTAAPERAAVPTA
jgi:hypothetical protein